MTFQINTAFYKETHANKKQPSFALNKRVLEVDVLTYDLKD